MDYYAASYEGDWVAHHGILGQKWGVRRFQNPDGTLTDKGRARVKKLQNKEARYNAKADKISAKANKRRYKDNYRIANLERKAAREQNAADSAWTYGAQKRHEQRRSEYASSAAKLKAKYAKMDFNSEKFRRKAAKARKKYEDLLTPQPYSAKRK